MIEVAVLGVGGVDYLHRIGEMGAVGGAVNVIAVPERVSLNHESSAGAGIFKKAPQLHIQYALVLFQPLLVKTVYKIVGTAVAELYAEKYVQTYLLTPCLGVLVALAVKLHTLFPRQIMGYGAVSVEKWSVMIIPV